MTPHVTVIGLGPAGPDLVTEGARRAIATHDVRFVRTSQHPSVCVVGEATSFDSLYDGAETFPQVYAAIVEHLIAAAQQHGAVLYAVPGSPIVAEHTVELMLRDARVTTTLVPALSFIDLAWTRLRIDPLAVGARMVDAHRFAADAAGERGPLLVAQCHNRAVLSDVKLALDVAPGKAPSVTVLHHLGLEDEQVVTLSWAELDHFAAADHLTSLWIPQLAEPVAAHVVELLDLVRTLRVECPWDAEQSHASLRRYVVEEAYELVDAIDADDAASGESGDDEMTGQQAANAERHLIEELGDVLFQVVFHATLGEEAGRFTFADVARTLADKLKHRHPHVFPRDDFDTGTIGSADDVVVNWERIKNSENTTTADIPDVLPALLYASKVLKRGNHRVEVDRAVVDENELGRRLLSLVASARAIGVDPEVALRSAATRLRGVHLADGTRRS